MKSRFFIVLLLTMLLVPTFASCGLRTLDNRLDTVEDAIDNRLDAVENAIEAPLNAVEDAVENRIDIAEAPAKSDSGVTPASSGKTDSTITQTEAETIALEHAGFSTDDVNYLRTEYDFDDGIFKYEVQFHQGYLEYEYDIHAETGEVLFYDIDD